MGILNWARRRRARKTLRNALLDEKSPRMRSVYQYALVNLDLGKNMEELVREGGWDALGTLWGQTNDVWSVYSTGDFENLMSGSAVIYACVSLLANLAAEAPMQVFQWGSDGEKDYFDDHFVYDKLHRPSERQEYRQFVYEIVSHLLLTGSTYVWKTRLRNGDIDALIPVPTSWITEHWKSDGTFEHYEIKQGGTSNPIIVKPEDMSVFTYPDPGNPSSPAGPAQAALKDLQVDDARARYMIEMLSNMTIPGTIISMENEPDEEQLREIRRRLIGKAGAGKRGAPMIVGADAKLVQGTVPPDVDWPGTAGISESRTCAAFKVPPIVVGLRVGLEHATLANYETAKRALYQNAMKPLWNDLAGFFERMLLTSEGVEDEEIEPDFSEISELQEDVDTLHARARDDFHGGLIDLDDARARIGEDELPNRTGKFHVLPMNLVPIIVDGDLVEPPEPEVPSGEEEEVEQFEGTGDGEGDDEGEGDEPDENEGDEAATGEGDEE